jgi:FkbM family methyltransferase
MPNPEQKNVVEVEATFGRIEAFADDLITSQIIAFGAHTRPEVAFLLSMVDAGDDVIDLGGHIGSFAIPLAARIGSQGRIVIVEGLPETFTVLERNVRRVAPAAAVTTVNVLIALPDQRYVARTPDGNTGATYFLPATSDDPRQAPVMSLDALCRVHFFPRVLKIDLEGFEEIALRGAPELLSRKPIIYCEVAEQLMRRNGSTVEQLDRLLRACGYRFFRNIGDRNAAHDNFTVEELSELGAGGDFFDALAVHRGDERLSRLLALSKL